LLAVWLLDTVFPSKITLYLIVSLLFELLGVVQVTNAVLGVVLLTDAEKLHNILLFATGRLLSIFLQVMPMIESEKIK
jgi:hypothetical protein